jgi:hypothetical protein
MAVKLAKIERYGDAGWMYELYDDSEPEKTWFMRTNKNGEGLWFVPSNGGQDHQVLGTCQYSGGSTEKKAIHNILFNRNRR